MSSRGGAVTWMTSVWSRGSWDFFLVRSLHASPMLERR